MRSAKAEVLLSKTVAFGAFFTTVVVLTESVTDPVNVTKLLSLGILSGAILGIAISGRLKDIFQRALVLWVVVFLFLLFCFISLFASGSPKSQSLYGVYGRNNGLLTYIFLSILLLAVASLGLRENLNKIVYALFFAGFINVIYSLWVIAFGDFIGWSNPYGNILGTFGNPNFVGSFLGIFFSAYFAYAIHSSSSSWIRFSAIILLPLTLYEIFNSQAIQGRVVAVGGASLVIFFFIRSRYNKYILLAYSLTFSIIGVFAALGALQIGPLVKLIYKESVSLRGQYWLAAWNTGNLKPLTGVGMDGFGDWYRRSRDAHALERPGINTVVDAAHNVPLDFFAYGGWPLFLSYLAIIGLGFSASLKVIRRQKKYDPIFVSIFVAWSGYQVQSVISINQIGLAIWGWILTGCLIAYEHISRAPSFEDTESNYKMKRRRERASQFDVEPRVVIFGATFALIGFLIASPPYIADSKWRDAQVKLSIDFFEASMRPSYFNPPNAMKYASNIQILEQNNLNELAHKYALEAVKWNPESFNLWKALYFIRNSTEAEKQMALLNMKRLDPLNPDVVAVK